MDRKRTIRVVWINTGIVLAVTILIVAANWYFTNKTVQNLNDELASAKQTEKTMKSKADELPNISKYLPRLLNESRILSLIFPNSPEQKEVFGFLQQNVEKADADVMSISMDQPKDLPAARATSAQTESQKALDKETVAKMQMISTDLAIRGGFQNVLAFTENMKRSNRFYRIMSIEARPADVQTGKGAESLTNAAVAFDLTGEMYFTTEKLDIAKKIDELRAALREVLAYEEPLETEQPANQLIEVKTGSPAAPGTNKEEKPAK